MVDIITPKVGVIVVAGGSGSRFGASMPKQFQFLGQRPVLAYSLNSFARALPSSEIVVVVAEDRVAYWQNLASRFDLPDHKVVVGGEQRYHSVLAGLEALSDDVEVVAVHDGARPLCSEALIERCVSMAISSGSAIPTIAPNDSLREVVADGVSRALVRANIRVVQTPQCFEAAILRRAYRQPYDPQFTDDASLVENSGERVWLCDGEVENLKITTSIDMLLAEEILERRNG
ncbi:MAG: 2-C-methyl-D-erythritol 4-phosphate cytidylyltransferase [Rikenellaceae bacterium]